MPPAASPQFPDQDPSVRASQPSPLSQPEERGAGVDLGFESVQGQGRPKSRIFWLFAAIVLAALLWREFPREIGRWYYAAFQDRSLDEDDRGALAMIELAIDWDAENAWYWLECGNIQMERGDYEQSWSKFDHAKELLEPRVEARPNRQNISLLAHALNGAAYARALAGHELEQAKKDVERALELAPASAAIIDTRGYIYYLTGDYEQALFDTNAAVVMSTATYELFKQELQRKRSKSIRQRQLDSSLRTLEEVLAELHEHRGLVYQKLGKENAARRDLAAAEIFKSRIISNQEQ